MAPELVVYAAYALAWAGWQWFASRKASARSRYWRAVAEAAGLTHLKEARSPGAAARVTAWCGSQEVELAWEADKKEPVVCVTVRGLLPGLVLAGQAGRAATAGDSTIGDDAFDQAIEVHGPDAAVRAILDAETRGAVRRLLGGSERTFARCVIAHGKLRVSLAKAAMSGEHERLAGALRMALAVTRQLVRPSDIPARLSRNARTDTLAGVRLRSLQALLREFPEHPATREALALARGDESEEVRLAAGLALGPAGLDLVREIAQAEDTGDGCAARAVVALGRELPVAGVLDLLRHALRRRRFRTAEAGLAWLGEHGGADSVEPLAKVLAIERGELAVAAAAALGVSGLPAAEAPLIRALESAIGEVRVAAAEALEGLGSAAAVWPLKEAAARHAGDTVLERVVRQAIAAIQSRLTGTPGQLSLAGEEAGRLALAEEDPLGQLSLAPPDEREKRG